MPLLFPYLSFAVDKPYFTLHDRDYFLLPKIPSQRTDHEPKYMEVLKKWSGTKDADGATWRKIVATYYEMISRIDDLLGRLMNKIHDKKLMKRLYTFFFTDHGE